MNKDRTPEFTTPRLTGGTTCGVDRRRFVGMVGASLASQWLIGAPRLGWSATAAPPTGTRLVPGYLRASHLAVTDENVLADLSNPLLPPHDVLRRVIPEDLPLEFVSSKEIGEVPLGFDKGCARVHVHGVLPRVEFGLADGVEAIHLEAEISTESEELPATHYVWGYDTGPVENISGPTRFDAAVGKGLALTLKTVFERAGRGSLSGFAEGVRGRAPAHILNTVWTLEDRFDAERLRPGVYCLPLNDDAAGAFPLVANRDWLVPDKLPYLLLSVQPVAGS